MKKRIECKIIGMVQMVMYRDFSQRKARGLGISGYVKNMPDGSVFLTAEGEEEKLNKLILKLKKGPMLAEVADVSVFWKDATGEFNDFKIEY